MIVMLLVGLIGFHICDRLDLSEEQPYITIYIFVILLTAKWSASLVKRLYGLCIFLIGIIGGFVSGTLLYATGVRILDYSGSFS